VTALAYRSVNPLLDISLRDVLGNSDAANDLNTQLTAYAYENGMKPYFTMFQKGYGTSVSLLQPLYAGGRIVNGNRLASLGVEASHLQGSLALKAVRDSVENKYWRIVSLQQKQKILLETAEVLDALDKDLSTAVRAGLALEADLLELRQKRSELKAGQTKLNGGLSLLKMDLLDDIGYEYSYLELPSLVLSDTPGELPEPSSVFADGFDLASVPQARLLQMQEKAAALEKKMAVGELLPQVAVGAAYGYSALSLPRDATSNGLVFAMVQVPITDLGKAAYRSKRLGYKIQDAQEERRIPLRNSRSSRTKPGWT
jgi:outer membrane protein TolC